MEAATCYRLASLGMRAARCADASHSSSSSLQCTSWTLVSSRSQAQSPAKSQGNTRASRSISLQMSQVSTCRPPSNIQPLTSHRSQPADHPRRPKPKLPSSKHSILDKSQVSTCRPPSAWDIDSRRHRIDPSTQSILCPSAPLPLCPCHSSLCFQPGTKCETPTS